LHRGETFFILRRRNSVRPLFQHSKKYLPEWHTSCFAQHRHWGRCCGHIVTVFPGAQQTRKTIIVNYKGYLIDMDGVIYRENYLLPGAKEFVEHLIQSATPFLFLTNNSAPTPEDLVIRLRHLGISGLSPRHFYTSAMNTVDFLREMHPNCSAFVIGEAGLTAALAEAKIPNDSIKPTYVIVGEGNPSNERMTKAHELIEKGARLVATNPDNWCPVKGNQTRPGAGALAAYLEASTGQRAYFLGKPNPYMFYRARRRLQGGTREIMMIGDTMETDIRGAIEIGMQACLVLTGSTQMDDIANYVYQPTCIMTGVDELLAEIKAEGKADTSRSPSFMPRELPMRERSKHQTDSTEFFKPRPRPAMTK
jgi:NagD protein